MRLGPTGGARGYTAITGEEPPFIELCWWINGKLMPELTVYRGQTYYFKVREGRTATSVADRYFIFNTVDVLGPRRGQ